jgi:hypothetical protein
LLYILPNLLYNRGEHFMEKLVFTREKIPRREKMMTSLLPAYPIHPIADALIQIDQGEDPWYAINSFLHDWWCYAVDYRQQLIAEALRPTTTTEGKRWAAFCAATVEELCERTGFPCPTWTNDLGYVLNDPWFYSTEQRDWLVETTPETFKRHNVFFGKGVLDNKYELKELFPAKAPWTIWSQQELDTLFPLSTNSESGAV